LNLHLPSPSPSKGEGACLPAPVPTAGGVGRGGAKLAGKEEFLFMEENTERRPAERILIWFLLALSLFVFVVAWLMPHETLSSSGAFPVFIGSVMILSVLRILWKERKVFASWKWHEELSLIQPFMLPWEVASYIGVLVVYIVVTSSLGFWVSSYLFLVGSFLLLKGARPIKALIIGIGMLVVIWLLFQYIFRIILW